MRNALFKTRITELLGIRHPILCGGLGPKLSDADYVSAVVNAGGMGFIVAAGFPDPEQFRDQLQRCRAQIGQQGYGVNLYISRQAGGIERLKKHLPILLEEGVSCVETAGASPEAILPMLNEAGIKVLHKVPAMRYARSVAKLPLDAVIVVGNDCGGHPGTYGISSMVYAAQAREQLNIPVIIAGGIGTGQQLTACLSMGADAILMGSRMLVAQELAIHHAYQQQVVQGDGSESIIVKTALRDHHRVLNNESAKAVAQLDNAGVRDFELFRPHVMGSLTNHSYMTGDSRLGMLDYGPAVAFANKIESVEGIFDQLIDQAKQALDHLQSTQI